MKAQHNKILNEILQKLPEEEKLPELKKTIIGFLKEKDPSKQMTFKEFLTQWNALSESPSKPLLINLAVSIGQLYEQGQEGLPQSANKASELYKCAALNENINGYFDYARCLFYGIGVGINLRESKKYLEEYYQRSDEGKEIMASYYLGLIYLAEEREQVAIECFKEVPENPKDHFQMADQLKKYIEEKNYFEISRLLFEIKCPELVKKFFDTSLKLEDYSTTSEMLKNSLTQLYVKIDPAIKKDDKKSEVSSASSDVSSNHVGKSTVSKKRKRPVEDCWDKNAENTLFDIYRVEEAKKKAMCQNEDIEQKRVKIPEQYRTPLENAESDLTNLLDAYITAIYDGTEDDEIGLTPIPGRLESSQERYDEKKAAYERDAKKAADLPEFKEKINLKTIEFLASYKEILRQYHAQERFFDPRRTKRQKTMEVATQLQGRRLLDASNVNPTQTKPVNISGTPARTMITAERSIIEASIAARGNEVNYMKLGLARDKNETLQLDSTEISYKQIPCKNDHLGNYLLAGMGGENGTYKDIYEKLKSFVIPDESLTEKQKEQALAKLMLGYAKSGVAITSTDLIKFKKVPTKNDVDVINRIFYHVLVKENSRRMVAKPMKHDFPFAIIQARVIKLIAEGVLTLKQVFDKDASFGVVTGDHLSNNFLKVIKKIININKLYNDHIRKLMFARNSSALFADSSRFEVIASSEALRQELHETYGGDSDSDGEGYDSSDESYKKTMRKLPTKHKLRW